MLTPFEKVWRRLASSRAARQCLLDALQENIEKSLAREAVRIGVGGVEGYAYRGEVANNAIKMAGGEVGLFVEKSEVSIGASTSWMRFRRTSRSRWLERLCESVSAA